VDLDGILLGRELIELLRVVFVLAINGTGCCSWVSSGTTLLDTLPVVTLPLPLGGACCTKGSLAKCCCRCGWPTHRFEAIKAVASDERTDGWRKKNKVLWGKMKKSPTVYDHN